ncbi:hypothetical protein [Muribaculum intestinale]|uniref:hypothetical protein n=1 Tax=Muribaculum intestinale TaxID=1796646 RepID=UPI0025B6B9E6|nr:hypothetical protein [Muribaculum intestinale]
MHRGVPAFYDYANAVDSFWSPSEIHLTDNRAFAYYSRYLFQKGVSTFKWGLPAEWPLNYYLYTLYGFGYVAVVNTDKYGVIPQACSLKGYNVFYEPTHAVIANPLLRGIKEPQIGRECVVLHLQPNYSGIMDIVKYHAQLMALAYETLTTNLLNSKLAYIATADNKAEAESLKKLYDQIASGVPAVVQRSRKRDPNGDKIPFEMLLQNVGSNFISPEILAVMRTIERNFDREVGIPTPSFEGRKERPIEAELQTGNFEAQSKLSLWLQSLKDGCKEVEDMFGLRITVEWRADRDGNIIDSGTLPLEQRTL